MFKSHFFCGVIASYSCSFQYSLSHSSKQHSEIQDKLLGTVESVRLFARRNCFYYNIAMDTLSAVCRFEVNYLSNFFEVSWYKIRQFREGIKIKNDDIENC